MKKIILFGILFLFVFASVNDSSATVLVVDGNQNSFSDETAFSSGTVENGGQSGDDEAGDYVIVACATNGEGPNTFNTPTPGNWTLLDTGACDNDTFCLHGIWGGFTDTANVEEITCSWGVPHFVFVAGTFRYRDVDVNNPIIDVACDAGTSDEIVAPSINTEHGAQVAVIGTYSFPEGFQCNFLDEQFTFAGFFACAFAGMENVSMDGFTETTFFEGPTGEATLDLFEVADWRACTIGLRMAPILRNIPTLSEWGFLAFAGFLGLAGIWALRRRQAVKA